MLTEQEIERAEDAARHSYRHHMSSVRGQLITQLDSYDYHLIKAVESAVIEKIKAQGAVAWAATSEEGIVEALGFNQSKSRFTVPIYKLPEGD